MRQSRSWHQPASGPKSSDRSLSLWCAAKTRNVSCRRSRHYEGRIGTVAIPALMHSLPADSFGDLQTGIAPRLRNCTDQTFLRHPYRLSGLKRPPTGRSAASAPARTSSLPLRRWTCFCASMRAAARRRSSRFQSWSTVSSQLRSIWCWNSILQEEHTATTT